MSRFGASHGLCVDKTVASAKTAHEATTSGERSYALMWDTNFVSRIVSGKPR